MAGVKGVARGAGVTRSSGVMRGSGVMRTGRGGWARTAPVVQQGQEGQSQAQEKIDPAVEFWFGVHGLFSRRSRS
ncbi:MAG: hypothetical protein V9H69_05235 [Anaerolineae bacterium]